MNMTTTLRHSNQSNEKKCNLQRTTRERDIGEALLVRPFDGRDFVSAEGCGVAGQITSQQMAAQQEHEVAGKEISLLQLEVQTAGLQP